MSKLLKLTKSIAPPFLWASCAAIYGWIHTAKPEKGMQRDASWYDTAFKASKLYKLRYCDTPYYAIWCVIADRLRMLGARSVLDIGCGPGQFARLVLDRGISNYCGIDFSQAQIQFARSQCPDLRFEVQDAFEFDFSSVEKDTIIVCTEVLEHLNEDIALVERFPDGMHVILSVPNFPSAGHVRHFESAGHVSDRYTHLFEDLDVVEFPVPGSERGVIFLATGVRSTAG